MTINRALDCDQNGSICDNFLRMCEVKFDMDAFVRMHGLCASTSVKVRAARGKNDANIEEMTADRGFGFHTNVK